MACTYNIENIKEKVYFMTARSKTGLQLYIDRSSKKAYVEEYTGTLITMKVNTIEYREEANLDTRFTFSRQLTFTVAGYYNALNIANYPIVVIESQQGDKYILNYDFPYEVGYTYDGNNTTITLSMLSDYPLLPIRRDTSTISSRINNYCRYNNEDITKWQVQASDAGANTFADVDGQVTDFNLTLEEGEYSLSLNIALPLLPTSENDWIKVEYYDENKKDLIISTPSGKTIRLYSLQSEYTVEGSTITWQLTGVATMLQELFSIS